MKVFKAVFIVIFPLMLIACVVQQLSHHVTIKETYAFMGECYKINTMDFIETLKEDKETFETITLKITTLPQKKDNAPLENIWNYVVWVCNAFVSCFAFLFNILTCIFDTLLFVINSILTFFRVIFYFFGFTI